MTVVAASATPLDRTKEKQMKNNDAMIGFRLVTVHTSPHQRLSAKPSITLCPGREVGNSARVRGRDVGGAPDPHRYAEPKQGKGQREAAAAPLVAPSFGPAGRWPYSEP